LATSQRTSEKDWKCGPKDERSRVTCPFYVVGPDPRGPNLPRRKVHTRTNDERIGKEFMRDFGLALLREAQRRTCESKQPKTLDEAVGFYLATKKRRSKTRNDGLRLQMARLSAYLKKEKHVASGKIFKPSEQRLTNLVSEAPKTRCPQHKQ
jgi:hypothetical protein